MNTDQTHNFPTISLCIRCYRNKLNSNFYRRWRRFLLSSLWVRILGIFQNVFVCIHTGRFFCFCIAESGCGENFKSCLDMQNGILLKLEDLCCGAPNYRILAIFQKCAIWKCCSKNNNLNLGEIEASNFICRQIMLFLWDQKICMGAC